MAMHSEISPATVPALTHTLDCSGRFHTAGDDGAFRPEPA